MLDRSSIDGFLAQKRIAVVGVSPKPNDFATAVVKAFREHDYDVAPVGAHAAEVDGQPAYPSLDAVPGHVDGVVVMVRADAAEGVVADAVRRGVRRVWLHKGVGKGADSAGAIAYCRANGVDVVEGACPLMFLDPVRGPHRFHRWISRRTPRRLAASMR